ncbi:hypothetical protein FQN60_012572, partial [Etheostoma spectabile]
TSDGGVLANSTFGRSLLDRTLGLPQDALLPEAEHLGPQPHVFIADEAFPLRHNLMRPFPGFNHSGRRRVFNFRLSHAIVENTLVFSVPMAYVRGVVGSALQMGACGGYRVLHNFFEEDSRRQPGLLFHTMRTVLAYRQ